MRKVYIVGIGMGNPDTLTIGGQRAVSESQGLVGARRMVDSFTQFCGEKGYAVAPEAIAAWIDGNGLDPIAVVMSGDVGFFSGTAKLSALLEEKNRQCADAGREPLYEVEHIAGISSLQYFCARLHKSWGDAAVISLHGREGDAVGEIRTREKTFLLTGSDNPAHEICRRLVEAGLGHVSVFIGEKLSYNEERIYQGTAEELSSLTFDPLSVMFVENDRPVQRELACGGMEDELFLRDKVPMTKSEVRSVTLSRLHLKAGDCIYDIGAGTGSVSIEMALAAQRGQVFAIETNPEGVELIQKNKEKFGAWNLQVVEGLAPQAMEGLPKPDKAFIGGTKGNLAPVIESLIKKNPEIRIVINAIALESMGEALRLLKSYGFEDIGIVQLSAARARPVGNYHMMMGQNPVFIISGQHYSTKESHSCRENGS